MRAHSGARTGRQVVQLCASRPAGAVERPERVLVAFAVVEAAARETVTVPIEVPARAWRHWDAASSGWAVEPGTVRLQAGASSVELPVAAEVEVVAGA